MILRGRATGMIAQHTDVYFKNLAILGQLRHLQLCRES